MAKIPDHLKKTVGKIGDDMARAGASRAQSFDNAQLGYVNRHTHNQHVAEGLAQRAASNKQQTQTPQQQPSRDYSSPAAAEKYGDMPKDNDREQTPTQQKDQQKEQDPEQEPH